MKNKELIVKCPMCKTPVPRQEDTFPFCSPRCKTTDLGNWASGAYTVAEEHTIEGYNTDHEPPIIH